MATDIIGGTRVEHSEPDGIFISPDEHTPVSTLQLNMMADMLEQYTTELNNLIQAQTNQLMELSKIGGSVESSDGVLS